MGLSRPRSSPYTRVLSVVGIASSHCGPQRPRRHSMEEGPMEKLHWKSATEIGRLIREKKVSACDALEHFLARVDRFNPKLNAIVWQDRARARARARAADAELAAGNVCGPLHGVPMT